MQIHICLLNYLGVLCSIGERNIQFETTELNSLVANAISVVLILRKYFF